MSGHTKEPWVYACGDAEHLGIIMGRHGGEVVDGEFSEANARRIVACVNACTGIGNDVLEAGAIVESDKLYSTDKALNAAIRQRDELLSMLDTLCNGLAWNIEHHPDVMNESDSEALQAARILLEKFGVAK